MVERLRGFYSALLKPAARLLALAKISANLVTIVGTLLATLAALIMIPQGWLWQAALVLAVIVLSDGLDGELARMTNQQSSFGAFLDSSLDRLADGAIFGAIVVLFALHQSLLCSLIALWSLIMGQLTSYIKARAEAHNFTCKGGIAARGDRLLIILLALLCAGLGVAWALEIGVTVVAVASTVTVCQRFFDVKRQATRVE